MSIETSKLNETEIIYPSELSIDEKLTYNESLEKSIKESPYSNTNKSNTLLNVLKDFSVRYDLDDKKIMKSKKFLLSFEDIISLVRLALEFQIKINNSLNLKDYLNEISQDFINNLSYYIFSYEKIDIQQNNTINNYINYKTYDNILITKNNAKYGTEFQTPIKYFRPDKKKTKNEQEISYINKNRTENNQNNKFYNKNKKVLSPRNDEAKNKKKEEANNKHKYNKSAEKRRNGYTSEFDNNSNSNKNNNNNEDIKANRLNKSTGKRNSTRSGNSISIYAACENLKGSTNVLKSGKSKRLSFVEANKNNKMVYYNQNLNIGVKKQIISNNVIKPSNMANKLLQQGMKYITDFKDIKEEESKKKY